MSRIKKKFQELKSQNKKAFVTYICAVDPNYETSLEILKKLPESGTDIIELGIPFLDPAGDGPTIEAASKRAIASGGSLKKTLEMVQEFRKINDSTPLLLMGYYNPFLKYGLDKIFIDAEKSGVDGILIVDLPFEEKVEINNYLSATKLDFINLVAPLTDEERIKKVTKNSSGFLYLVSMLGITGTKQASLEDNIENLKRLRRNSDLPIVIGFGIQNKNQVLEFSKLDCDGVVVGSAIVKEIEKNYLEKKDNKKIVENTLLKVAELSLVN